LSETKIMMNWHARYLRQATWTRDLRKYLFERAGLAHAHRILEVGCGSGAILSELPESLAARFGLDLDIAMLGECRVNAPNVSLIRADGHHLPYPDQSFDIAYCHYLLLWVKDPLQVVKEMARVSRHVIAFAEPDYSQRIDEPAKLKPLGALQTESLRRQGANPSFGSILAETFFQAGIKIEETGLIQGQDATRLSDGQENEWAVIESDLRRVVPDEEIQKMKMLDEAARKNRKRILHIPTFFAWGQV
jgi:ubiquinone/menaquinone biosynthesis C-methylase UbiE